MVTILVSIKLAMVDDPHVTRIFFSGDIHGYEVPFSINIASERRPLISMIYLLYGHMVFPKIP